MDHGITYCHVRANPITFVTTGMTETATLISTTSEHDILKGSSGSLIPGVRAKLVGFDGKIITEYEKPGELMIQSPSVVPGYLNNEKANEEAFFTDEDGRWIRTGDEVLIRKSTAGHEHLFILDRIKELIKTKVRSSVLDLLVQYH